MNKRLLIHSGKPKENVELNLTMFGFEFIITMVPFSIVQNVK